jgi:molecular chaperone DnaK
MCYTLERQISENKDKLPADAIGTIESLIKEGREAVEKQDDSKVTDVLTRLEKEAHAMATKLYETTGGAGPGAPPGGAPGGSAGAAKGGDGGGKKGDVIDAEFEESN